MILYLFFFKFLLNELYIFFKYTTCLPYLFFKIYLSDVKMFWL